jgi:transglutaminase-like putative cysteine protease
MQATVTVEHRDDALLTGKRPWLRLLPEDGWLTLVLLIVVVYTTTASIQAVTPPWAPGLTILTATTGVGLLLGYLAVQQGRLPGTPVHIVALALGIAFAFQATANATLGGKRGLLLQHTNTWFQRAVLNHESSSDNTVFLLFLAILSFLLAYISIWLVLHTRRPWLAALANGVVLMINLNWATEDRAVFFIVLYLLATLLLLVRFTLAENIRVWRVRGLRFSPDLGWDFMQAGAIFAVVVLTLANVLPIGAGNSSLLSAWNSSKNPWQSVQTTFQTLFNGVQGGPGPGSGAGFTFFGSNLSLLTNPDLKPVPILHYSTSGDASQYLVTQTMDQYQDGTWTSTPAHQSTYSAFKSLPTGMNQINGAPTNFKSNSYQITLNQTLGDRPLFAPGSAADSFSAASQTLISDLAGVPVQWMGVNDQKAGTKYTAEAWVSTATISQLQQVKAPNNDPNSAQDYPSDLVSQYLTDTSPTSVPPLVAQDAKAWTSGAIDMYDAATDIQDYLHSSAFTYSLQVSPPPNGQDPVAYFLTNRVGFCTYFATAMVLMARFLGMPSRIALGFATSTNSEKYYDAKTNTWVVLGTEAHVWPQIYFGKYGWINFEPTSSFTKFGRSTGNGTSGNVTPQPTTGAATPRASVSPNLKNIGQGGGPGPSKSSGSLNPIVVGAGLAVSLLIIFALLGLALLASWWRLLYRGLSPVAAAFARIARLGAWVGAVPKSSQTPDEYIEQLGRVVPAQRVALQRLGHLYARERWGGGLAEDASAEVPHLYNDVRESLAHQVVQRFRALPVKIFTSVRSLLVGAGGYNGPRRTP